MVSSEIQKRIINLGKALIEELGLDPGVDTLARWMAHYIAEQIAIADHATGDDRIEAEQHCFETILKLWQHRSSLPNGRRPFESFEPIFHALERLDPENPTPYYYAHPGFRSSEPDDTVNDSDTVQQWLDIAYGIDQTARIFLEYVSHQAALSATDEKTLTWLENSKGLQKKEDVLVITHLLNIDQDEYGEGAAHEAGSVNQEKLEARIEKLDAFLKLSQILRAELVDELKGVFPNVNVNNDLKDDGSDKGSPHSK